MPVEIEGGSENVTSGQTMPVIPGRERALVLFIQSTTGSAGTMILCSGKSPVGSGSPVPPAGGVAFPLLSIVTVDGKAAGAAHLIRASGGGDVLVRWTRYYEVD